MYQRIWLSICVLFFIFNLKLLIDDYDLINYMIVNKDDQLYCQSNKLLFCIDFGYIKDKDNFVCKNRIIKNVSSFEFINLTIKSVEFNLKSLNLFKINQTFIFHNSICFLVDKKQLETVRPLNGLLRYYRFSYLYADPNLIHPINFNYIFQKSSLDLYIYNLKIKRQKIYGLNYLKNPNCLNEKLSNRIECINKCLDLIDALFGFYDYLDHRKFDLEKIACKKRIKRQTNSIELLSHYKYFDKNDDYDKLIRCLNNCPNNNCSYEIYDANKLNANPFKSFNDKIIDFKSSIYLAYYLINDFWLQLIGLICLITGNCLINLLLSFWNFVFKKIKSLIDNENRREYFKYLIYYYQKYLKFMSLKFIFLSLFLIYILIESLMMIKEYDYKSRYPNRTSYIDYSTNLPSFIVCFPVQLLIFDKNFYGMSSDSILNHTYQEIANVTNTNPLNLIEEMEIFYGNTKRLSQNNKFDWSINNTEIYFKGSRLVKFRTYYLSRCFRIELEYLDKLRYEYLNPIHYFDIKFKTPIWNLFLVDKNQNFEINSTEIKGGRSFRKIEISRLVNCNNLKNDKMIRINRCINERFIDQFDSLPLYSLIDRNELIYLNLSIDNLKFNTNRSNYNQIESDCKTKFNNLIDCNVIKFEETFKETQTFTYESIRINLNYETYYEYEFEQSLTKLFLDILNLVSISLGITAIGFLSSLSKLIKFKLIKIIIITICLIGFLVHNLFIFKGIVEEKLSHSLYFERLDSYRLPNILICVDLGDEIKINDNYKLTPNYLDKITNQFNLDQVIEYISYFNKTTWNLYRPASDNNLNNTNNNDEISIKTLYFLNFKCFKFEFRVEVTDNNLLMFADKYFLHIYIHRNFISNGKSIYILYTHFNSDQFSDLLKYRFEYNRNSKLKHTSYNIVFELIEIDKEDNFELIKNPLSLLYGRVNLDDTTCYLNNLRNKFKQLTNSTTREIMIEDDNFDLEIDEDLFKQYYLQIQNYTDHNYPTSLNLKENYYDSQTYKRIWKFPRIRFSILASVKKIKITNQDNNAKLLLNLLNTLSLWLDICILDLYKYYYKYRNLIINSLKFKIKLYRFLIRLRIRLKNVSKIQLN